MPSVSASVPEVTISNGTIGTFDRHLSFGSLRNQTIHITASGSGNVIISPDVINLIQTYQGCSTSAVAANVTATSRGVSLLNAVSAVATSGPFDSLLRDSITLSSPSLLWTGTNTITTAAGSQYRVTTSDGFVLYDSIWESTGKTASLSSAVINYRARRGQVHRKTRHLPFVAAVSPAEQKARDTLRDLLSEADWRGYITNGFIVSRGPSGRRYQIFRDQRRTVVWDNGREIARICIHTDQDCPPTDHVLNLKILTEIDEDAVWAGGNVTATWLGAG